MPEELSLEYVGQKLQEIEDLLYSHKHTGGDLTRKLSGVQISRVQVTDASTLGDGKTRSGSLTMLLAPGQGDVQLRAGIDSGDFSNVGAKTGFIFGIDDSDSDKVKFYFGTPTSYMKYDGSSFTVVGGVSVSEINIPDTTTASSFHTDTSGNSWWGANVATGLSGANASITSAGLAKFKNILIGGATIQYQVTNSGIFSFGDGSDGAGVADGVTALAGAGLAGSTYTLTRDVYYTDLTISTGVIINPGGYRIFGSGTLTMNGTAKIARDGNSGSNAAGTTAGAGGAALADGYLKGSAAGGNGGNGATAAASAVAGTAGASTANSIGANGAAGGAGADWTPLAGGTTAGAAGGSAGTATASNVKLIANWHLATLLDVSSTGSTVKFNNSAGSGGGGGGGNDSSTGGRNGGGGGGGGSAGGIVAIYFRVITIDASASITANGGNGGNGANSTTAGSGGGGGGGGSGGQLVLVYNTITNSGSLAAAAGNGGSAGTGTGSGGHTGTAGTAGNAGTIRQFQVSL